RSNTFTAAAFNLPKGELSDPVQIARGWALLDVAAVNPPHVPTFKEAEKAVRDKVINEKEHQVAAQKLEQAKKEMAAGKSLDEVAKALGVTVEESGEFTANGMIPKLGMSPKISEAAMTLDKGDVGGPIEMSQGEVLFQVTERQRATEAGLAAKKEELRDQIEQEKVGRLLASLIAKRRDELNVTFSKPLLKSFGLLDTSAQPKQG
ncbi:MAG TPA: peptidylprolyl isomerase, partial [Thermoanaerobaculia bacterium]|nr:peptidylprolyl isomerase [Thermoanaerobaculia bacterium]